MITVSIDKLRPKLGTYVRQCAITGEEILVTIGGIPAARIVPVNPVAEKSESCPTP